MQTLDDLQRVKELFHLAMEREPHERADFLRNACLDNPTLQQEVESLLVAYLRNEDFLEAAAIETSAAELTDWLLNEPEETPFPMKRIGAYQLLREIGRGGMGTVYLAKRDDDQYEQQVAIKLIKRGMDTDQIIRRFRKERQILADLNHPNIVRLLDGGVTEDGLSFLVMEYVEGMSIDEYADTHHLSIDERLKLFREVCNAVHYAHLHKVIHRDLKPSNILITPDGTPKLLDFGIAKLLDTRGGTDSPALTLTALRVMTPEYASPELLRGLSLTVSSDVYSLGVLFYELLTGERPFEFKSRVPQEIFQTILETEPRLPSDVVTDRKLRPLSENQSANKRKHRRHGLTASPHPAPATQATQFKGDLDNIVLMSIQKEPENRYLSVEQFSEDIRRYLQGLPVLARKDSRLYRGIKFFKRHKTSAFVTLAVALLCLLAGLSVGLFTKRTGTFKPGSKERVSVAVLPFRIKDADPNAAYLSDGITNILITNLSRLQGLSVPALNSVYLYKDESTNPQSIGRELGVETILKGAVEQQKDHLFISVELIDAQSNERIWSKLYQALSADFLSLQPEMVNDVARELGLKPTPEEQKKIAHRYTNDVEAYNLYLKGRYLWSQRTDFGFRKAVDYFQQAIKKDPNYALAYSGLADSFSLMAAYKMVPQKKPFMEAKSAALKALELDGDLAQAHTSLALVSWLYDWDWQRADREFRQAMELDPQYPIAPHWYGLYLGEMGRPDEALASINKALAIDPRSPYIHADLARILFYARRYDESLAQYRRTMGIAPNFSTYYGELSYLYEQMGMEEEWFSLLAAVYGVGLTAELSKDGLKAYWQSQFQYLNRDAIAPTYYRAEVFARLGKTDLAIEELNRIYTLRDHQMAQLKVNPVFDPLRSDPRFQELLRRMNLVP
jgi:serine/threonine protein kinase/TolB-like protein/Tfp pilus assembly protein PilF